MFAWLKSLLPEPRQLAESRWLRWLGPRLLHPSLWHFSRRGVALGVALGVFFGLLIPVAQIPLSAAAAVALRANLPAAAASTLVTNPVTFAPLYYLAWKVGAALLDTPAPVTEAAVGRAVERAGQAAGGDERWWAMSWRFVSGVGRPLVLGLALLSVTAGLLSYVLISVGWQLRVRWRRRTRTRARARSRNETSVKIEIAPGPGARAPDQPSRGVSDS